jgi:hypothetical protein
LLDQLEALENLTSMTKAQEFSIQVQSKDPAKKEKPKSEEPVASASSAKDKDKDKDKKDGEELVRVQLYDQSQNTDQFSVRGGSAA